jgi:NitT/TauT family transport system substrate-binding protein
MRGIRSGKVTRGLTLLVAVTAVTVVLAGCSSGGGTAASPSSSGKQLGGKPEKASITVTYGTDSPSTAPLWIGSDEGIFKKYGLTVNAVQGTSNVGAIAVVSGQADIYFGESTTSFQAVNSNQPLEIVGGLRNLNDFKLFTQPGVTSVSQLKGKSVAISAAGDSTDLSTRIAFQELKSSTNDVTLLATGTSASRFAALQTGKVAATLLTEPTATLAKNAGEHLMLDMTKKPFLGSAVTVSKTFAKNDPNTIVRFLEAIEASVKWLQDPANKDAALQLIGTHTETAANAPATLQAYTEYSTPGQLAMDPTPNTAAGQAIVNGLKQESASMYATLTLKKVYDYTFTDYLKSSGALKKIWGSKLKS